MENCRNLSPYFEASPCGCEFKLAKGPAEAESGGDKHSKKVDAIQIYCLISVWDKKFDIVAARGAYQAFMSKYCFLQWQATVFRTGKSKGSRKAEKL